MHERMQSSRKGSVLVSGGLVALLVTIGAGKAVAQTPPAGAPTPAEAAPPGEAPPSGAASEAAAPPPATAPLKPEPPPVPPPATPAPAELPFGAVPKGPVPPAPPPAMPNIDYGGRLRSAVRFQGVSDPKALNDAAATLYADLYASGQINRMWRWLLAITSNEYGGSRRPDEHRLHVRAGRDGGFHAHPRIPDLRGPHAGHGRPLRAERPVEPGRVDLSGVLRRRHGAGVPPGVPPAVPKAGPAGRDVGVAAWGVPLGGHIKYYLGAYQLQDPTLSPLYSGRVQVSLLSREPGWFHRTTYYGDRDLVSVGIGGQTRRMAR